MRLVGFNSYANSFRKSKTVVEPGATGGPGALTPEDIKLLAQAQKEIKRREFILPKCCIGITWCLMIIWCLGCVWVILLFGIQFDLDSEKGPVCVNESVCTEECIGDDTSYQQAVGYEISMSYLEDEYVEPPNYEADWELPKLDTARWLLSFGISFTLSLFVFSFGSLLCVSMFYYWYYKSRNEVGDDVKYVKEPWLANLAFKRRNTIIPKNLHWTAIVNDPSGLLEILRKNDEEMKESVRRSERNEVQ